MCKTTILMIVFLAPLLCVTTVALAKNDVYRWVDKNGVVHFGDQQPDQVESEIVQLKTDARAKRPAADDAPASAVAPAKATNPAAVEPEPSFAQQRRDERAKRRQAAAKKNKALSANCTRANELVARLEPSTRVLAEQADGTPARMDDNKRIDMLNDAKSYVSGNCNKKR